MAKLLSSAPTLEDIAESIERFYCGETKSLQWVEDCSCWTVMNPDGSECKGVRVIEKRGRYRFEMV